MTPENPPARPAEDAAPDQRMADLATFANGVVHDIRNPLNVIRSNVYLLRQRLSPEDAKALKAVNRIDDQVGAAMRLLEGIQAIYRSDQPSLQTVNLSELVRSVAETTVAPEGTQVVLEVEDAPLVSADPQLLDAALRALIRNAMEALPGGGTIRLHCGRHEDYVRLTVEDDGPGIEDSVLSQVFEPFTSTRRGHSGLGLTMVDKVARAHGGRALATPGPGACVGIELPVR